MEGPRIDGNKALMAKTAGMMLLPGLACLALALTVVKPFATIDQPKEPLAARPVPIVLPVLATTGRTTLLTAPRDSHAAVFNDAVRSADIPTVNAALASGAHGRNRLFAHSDNEFATKERRSMEDAVLPRKNDAIPYHTLPDAGAPKHRGVRHWGAGAASGGRAFAQTLDASPVAAVVPPAPVAPSAASILTRLLRSAASGKGFLAALARNILPESEATDLLSADSNDVALGSQGFTQTIGGLFGSTEEFDPGPANSLLNLGGGPGSSPASPKGANGPEQLTSLVTGGREMLLEDDEPGQEAAAANSSPTSGTSKQPLEHLGGYDPNIPNFGGGNRALDEWNNPYASVIEGVKSRLGAETVAKVERDFPDIFHDAVRAAIKQFGVEADQTDHQTLVEFGVSFVTEKLKSKAA